MVDPTRPSLQNKQQEEQRERKSILTKQEGRSGWLPIADHVLSTRQQPSCATAQLLQAQGEMLSILMMKTVEMVF